MIPGKRIYIAGPIKDQPNDNRGAFRSAAVALAYEGYDPVNPHDVAPRVHPGPCPEMGYQPGLHTQGHTSSCCFMRTDVAALLGCDGIFLLPGWERSRGASLEAAIAEGVGIPRIQLVGDRCVLCGCTEDCACVSPLGEPCSWVRPGICSSCFQGGDGS